MISFDTEDTGLDFKFGARPFCATLGQEDGSVLCWEWLVDPLTREVLIPEEDSREIRQRLAAAHEGIVGQNIKFDAKALLAAGISDWTPLWPLTEDTLIAGHLLASNHPHDLTSMALEYLGIDIQPFEDRLEDAVQEARRWCRSHLPEWAIAKAGRADMPSAKEKTWKYDCWLPRALRQFESHGPKEWDTVLSEYACADAEITLALWKVMEKELHRRGLWEIYRESMQLPPILLGMEEQGVTLSRSRLEKQRQEYQAEAASAAERMLGLAKRKGFALELPKGASPNNSLRTFLFETLKAPVLKRSDKTWEPSMDKDVLERMELECDGDVQTFVTDLMAKRKRDTATTYMESYTRFWQPLMRYDSCLHCKTGEGEHRGDAFVLYPSLNQTGTDTLRMSSQSPNEQNISKKENFNLRYSFGPAPGREWWALDYENLELRIPAYASGQRSMIDLFEQPDEPPFFGSYHLLNASIIYPDLFWPSVVIDKPGEFKNKYKATWYQWCKNAGFALIYGCQEATFDRAARKQGAYVLLREKLPDLFKYNDKAVQEANRLGYVSTLPDKTVDPTKGYPLLCSRSDRGMVLPTVPLNYKVQGTAMWVTRRAMVRCDTQLEEWRQGGFDARMVMQVHDELVFDFPKGGKRNLPKINKLRSLMEDSGDDIGVPLRVNVSWHPNNWAEEVKVV